MAATLMLVACNGDGDDTSATTTARPRPTASTTTTTTTTGPPCPAPPGEIAAERDVDGDGDEEVWMVVGHGASTTVMGLFLRDGCELRAVQIEGADAQFAVGGPVLLLQGVRCEANRVVHLGATSEDGENFAALDLVYELRGTELVRVDDATSTFTADDPELQAYSSFDC